MSTDRFDAHLIRKPHVRPTFERGLWGLVNLALWAFLTFLWVPLLTLIAWKASIYQASTWLATSHHTVDVWLLLALPLIALCCCVLLIAWAEYERYRFRHRGQERRTRCPDTDIHAIAEVLDAPAHVVDALAGARIVCLRMDNEARPFAADVLAPGVPRAAQMVPGA